MGGTLGDRFTSSDNALNAMRLVLAASVIVWHAHQLPLRNVLPPQAEQLLKQVGVDGFFAISGFLIVRSWMRRPEPRRYLLSRAARLLPALWMCLLVTAFVIIPISAFIADHKQPTLLAQVKYVLGNAAVYMGSPGMDGMTPPGGWTVWNISLWTLTWEAVAYLAVLAAGVAGLLTVRGVAGVAVWCWIAGLMQTVMLIGVDAVGSQWHLAVPRLGLMFSCGALLWMLRDRVPVSRALATAAVLLIVVGSFTPNYRLLAAPALAYLCIVLSLELGRWRVMRPQHDLSYGIYVYGAPVQVALIAVGFVETWATFTAATFAIVLPLAAASWFLVERPALQWARHSAATLTRGRLRGAHARAAAFPSHQPSPDARVSSAGPANPTVFRPTE